MLLAIASVLLAIAIIDRSTRMARVERLVLSTRYKLFNLRDILRRAAIDRTVDPNSWLFDYLDTSLTRAAGMLASLNLFEIAYFAAQAGDEAIAIRVRSLNVELNHKGNSRFRAVHEGFQKCILDFLEERHRAIGRTARFGVRAVRSGQYLWQRLKKRSSVALISDPRISTLGTYCDSTHRP
jgi:hypothetical protein